MQMLEAHFLLTFETEMHVKLIIYGDASYQSLRVIMILTSKPRPVFIQIVQFFLFMFYVVVVLFFFLFVFQDVVYSLSHNCIHILRKRNKTQGSQYDMYNFYFVSVHRCTNSVQGTVKYRSCNNPDTNSKFCNLFDTSTKLDKKCRFCPDQEQDVSASLMGFQYITKVCNHLCQQFRKH